MTGPLLFEAAKRGGARVRFTIASFNGSAPFLDVREWVEKDGEPIPTRKGATIPLEALEPLGEALIAAGRSGRFSGHPSDS